MNDSDAPEGETVEMPRGEGPGGRIGPFRILQQLGEGGFGAVFEAEQEHPVKRRVALKIIKLGMDTREVIARFEAERQALALMDHPHIAHVFDAGTTETGRPYFVMELVKGEPISSYCTRHKLPIVQRLQLFDQVCAAVQHAHTKGIIHRDLKPNNVLVSTQDGLPFVKVIDFGIAKATSGRLTDKTLFTEQFLMMGTPLYMSPEQAEGSADIDTRTDIYALGVILYELLTDTTPIDSNTLRTAGYAEIQRIIREVEPPPPSARLSRSATTKVDADATHWSESDSRRLTRMVRGELDWIVMKAIEKDRGRRYETANAFAMDVRRYLAGDPVLAAPPSASYRLRKFVRRHKGGVAAGAMVAVALLVGIAGFAWQARIARARADDLEQVSEFQAEMLRQVNPTEAGVMLTDDVRSKLEAALIKAGMPESERAVQIAAFATQWRRVNATDAARDLIDETILKPAVAAIYKQFKNQPLVDATLRQTLADRYVDMGLYDAAMPLQQSALATRRRMLGDQHPDTLDSIGYMGKALLSQGKLDEAERYDREALEKRRLVLGPDHPDTLSSMNNMGMLLKEQGKFSEAETYFREALQKRRSVLGEEHADTLMSINNLAALLQEKGNLNEAERLYREALEKRRRVLGKQNPSTLMSVGNLGTLLYQQGKLADAEPYYREALANRRQVLGENHPDTLQSISNLAVLLDDQGKPGEADPYYREAVEKYRLVLGDEHPDTLTVINNMGVFLLEHGRLSEAEPFLREALEQRRRILGPEHPVVLISTSHLGSLFVAQGKNAEAVDLLAPVEMATRKTFTDGNLSRVASFLVSLGKARAELKRFTIAESNLLEAHSILLQAHGPTHGKDNRECIQALVALYIAWNAAEPGKGYDAKAAEWKIKFDALGPREP